MLDVGYILHKIKSLKTFVNLLELSVRISIKTFSEKLLFKSDEIGWTAKYIMDIQNALKPFILIYVWIVVTYYYLDELNMFTIQGTPEYD